MKRKIVAMAMFITLLTTSTAFIAQAAVKDDIAKIREATSQFQHTHAARAAGYNLVSGLDYCFQSYGVGGMGYHYINTDLLDTTMDLLHPEALVYAPDVSGSLYFGAVVYMIPADSWNVEHDEPPQALGRSFYLNERLGTYMLHAWIWKHNPSGMFENWNPNVSCPEPLQWNGPRNWR